MSLATVVFSLLVLNIIQGVALILHMFNDRRHLP
jgi:hypothetical protein